GPESFIHSRRLLMNIPAPQHDNNPAIAPQLKETIYRGLEGGPPKRYASQREFAPDLEHQDQVGVAERPELRDWKRRRRPWPRRILFYLVLALIPVIIFALLLYVARRG